MRNKKSFTLIELIMVIVILGILAIVAVPKYIDLSGQANQAAEQGVLGGVRSGISTFFAFWKAYPPTLDSSLNSACSPTNACFTNVLSQGGIISQWTKTSATTYTGPTGTIYTYNAVNGTFQ